MSYQYQKNKHQEEATLYQFEIDDKLYYISLDLTYKDTGLCLLTLRPYILLYNALSSDIYVHNYQLHSNQEIALHTNEKQLKIQINPDLYGFLIMDYILTNKKYFKIILNDQKSYVIVYIQQHQAQLYVTITSIYTITNVIDQNITLKVEKNNHLITLATNEKQSILLHQKFLIMIQNYKSPLIFIDIKKEKKILI